MGQYKDFMGFLLQKIHVFLIRKREFFSFSKEGCEFCLKTHAQQQTYPLKVGETCFTVFTLFKHI